MTVYAGLDVSKEETAIWRPVRGYRHWPRSLILWAFRRGERDVARRSIGQERFGFAGRTRSGSSLDELGQLIGWRPVVRAKGGIPRIVATGMSGRDEQETLRKLHEWNQPIHRTRGRIEKIFGTWKRSYGLRRMRWRGLAKAAVQVHLTAIAYNLKRTMKILAVQA
jgi:hypothetical protein